MMRNLIYCLFLAVLCSCKSKKEEVQPFSKCDEPITRSYFRLIDKKTGDNLVSGAHAKISPDSIHIRINVKDSIGVQLMKPGDLIYLPSFGGHDTLLITTGGKYYVLPLALSSEAIECGVRLSTAIAGGDPAVLVADSIGCVNIPFNLN
ncbi:hypothetical protein [Chitinophaga vietnamensis]|uniref:hypothetical protein n=1 Tax=Chitinophaga vietnamensis TaxID=2593957 RepID=UPI0011783896|nr:hypothetical protein [Chitinophaga vietnamensis]